MRLKRRRHKQNTISFKALVFGFVITLLSFSIGYSLLSQNLSIKGTVNLPSETITKNEFRTDDLLLTYQINSWYSNGKTHYQYNFTLENIGVNDFSEWYLKIYLPVDAEQVGGWEARYTLDLGELLAQNMEGRTLESGTTASFGHQFSTTDDEFELKKVDMNGVVIVLGEPGEDSGGTGGNSGEPGEDSGETGGDLGEPGDHVVTGAIEVSLKKNTSWGSRPEFYHQYSFTINNISEQNLTEWTFDIAVTEGTTIHQNWGCNYIDKEGIITLSNSEYNGNISSGASQEATVIFISSSSEINVSVE